MNLTQILEATVSPDQNELQQAQTYLEQAAQENLPQFIVALVNELADGGKSQVARMAAGLQLKNALTSKDQTVRMQHQQRWLALDEQVKRHVKQMVIQTLGTEAARPAIAPQCIAAIACTEIPKGQWLEVIDILHRMVWAVASKEQALQSVGYICEDIDPNHITGRSREIQAAIVLGGMINPNINIKLTAFSALSRSLKVLEPHFNVKAERDIIMEILCQAREGDENQVRVIALQNLVKIMERYYQHMEHYMDNVLPGSISAIESNCDEVALQGIEFWSSVCDKEIDLAKKAAECKFYAKDALSNLIPVLINFLNRQGGLDDKDDWNPRKAAGVCLMLLVECCQDDVYRHVLRVLMENKQDYRSRVAAFMAFGFILEGPHLNAPKHYFREALETLNNIEFSYANVIVTDSLARTLCRIWELVPHVALENTKLLVKILLEGIDGEPCVAVNVCLVLRSLMVAFDNTVQHEEEGALISNWTILFSVSKKLSVLNSRLDANQEDLKSAVDKALLVCQRVLERYALKMLNKLACENVNVTDSLEWTLCRICVLLPDFALANTEPLVNILSKGVDEEPCVALNVFPVLMSLFVAFDTTVQHKEERPLINKWLQLSKRLFDLNRKLDPKQEHAKAVVEKASRNSRRLLERYVMPTLIKLMKDENVIVTHPLAWTLCRICELLPHVALANTERLVKILSKGLDKEPRVAVKVCSVLRLLMVTFIESHAAHEEEAPLIGLGAMWLSVSEKLGDLIRRLDANQEELKSAVEEASRICRKVLKMYIPAAEL